MTQDLPAAADAGGVYTEPDELSEDEWNARAAQMEMLWGGEICRLEYLFHLLETGRIKDECEPQPLPLP